MPSAKFRTEQLPDRVAQLTRKATELGERVEIRILRQVVAVINVVIFIAGLFFAAVSGHGIQQASTVGIIVRLGGFIAGFIFAGLFLFAVSALLVSLIVALVGLRFGHV